MDVNGLIHWPTGVASFRWPHGELRVSFSHFQPKVTDGLQRRITISGKASVIPLAAISRGLSTWRFVQVFGCSDHTFRESCVLGKLTHQQSNMLKYAQYLEGWDRKDLRTLDLWEWLCIKRCLQHKCILAYFLIAENLGGKWYPETSWNIGSGKC